jgi:hypothetical protein
MYSNEVLEPGALLNWKHIVPRRAEHENMPYKPV